MSKALVIDDSRAIRMILGRILKRIGYTVREAANGKEALALLAADSEGTTLALVDWNMPEMTGIEFVRAVRAIEAYREMILIMVTTETETEQMMTALEEGANEYIMKPFTEDMIVEKIRMATGGIPCCQS